MPRYKLFLLERPSGDARTIQRATWALPSALDVGKLGKALKGEIEVDWLEIAASDKKRDIVKIQRELARHGCMLAIDDAGGTLTKDLTGAIRQALSREGRRQSRERARQQTIWERGEGWRAIPVALARHARATVSVAAALAVLGGSVALLATWMDGAPRAGGGADASALDRLAAFGRGNANLPAIPESADGSGAGEPGEPASRGGARPLPAGEPDGGRPAIPDVPSGGGASASGVARAPEADGEAASAKRAIEIAGFAVGIGGSALVELFARRGARRANRRSRVRSVLMRLVPAAIAAGLAVGALVAMEAATAPMARAPAAKASKPAQASPPAGPAARHDARKAPIPGRTTGAAPAARPAPSYKALISALSPAPDPCAGASSSFERFLCVERLRHPGATAAADGEDQPAELADAGAASAAEPRVTQRRPTDEPAAARTGATSSSTSATAPRAATSDEARPPRPVPGAAAPAGPSAAGAAAPAGAPGVPARAEAPAAAPAASPVSSAPTPTPSAARPAPPRDAPKPVVTARHDLLAALPTFLLGLLAGTVGLAIVALGMGGGAGAKKGAP